MKTLELARHFIDCIEGGDLNAARACFHDDAGIWHNYDNVTQSVDQNMAVAASIIGKTKSRKYDYKRLVEIDGGYLQQHTLRVVTQDGKELAAEAIAVVVVEDGKIKRIEEYLDPTPLAALRGQVNGGAFQERRRVQPCIHSRRCPNGFFEKLDEGQQDIIRLVLRVCS